jgi:spermidine synthase
LLFSAEPKRIAMIGLGGGSMPKYCYHRLPQASVVVAENDPNVIALRAHFRVPENDARFEVRCEDGAQLVRRASDAFDVLIVDGFDREGQPAQLCSQRFYDDCHGALASDGIMVVNLLGDAAETEIYLDRIRLSFDGAVIVVPDADGSNRIVFACKGRLLDIPEQRLLGRLRQLESQHPLMLRRTVKSILHQRRTAASRA